MRVETKFIVMEVLHGDHGITPEVWEHLGKIIFNLPGGFFIRQEVLPGIEVPCGLYGPLMGDLPVEEGEVTYRVRGTRTGPSRTVDLPMRKTRIVTAIGIRNSDGAKIFTAYGGATAPREWWDPAMKPRECVESAQFWAEHALSRDV